MRCPWKATFFLLDLFIPDPGDPTRTKISRKRVAPEGTEVCHGYEQLINGYVMV